jgi:hypothetical protein
MYNVKGISKHRTACEEAHHLELQEKEFEKATKASKVPPRKWLFLLILPDDVFTDIINSASCKFWSFGRKALGEIWTFR